MKHGVVLLVFMSVFALSQDNLMQKACDKGSVSACDWVEYSKHQQTRQSIKAFNLMQLFYTRKGIYSEDSDMSNIQAFTLDANKRVFIGCFNHTQQCAINLYIDDADELDELLSAICKADLELTIECLEIDDTNFDTIRYFSELSNCLESVLEKIDQYDSDQVADFINLFGVNQLEQFVDAHTGIRKSDFKDFAIEQAGEWLDSENVPDTIQAYFDYDAYQRDIEHDYVIGEYVWINH